MRGEKIKDGKKKSMGSLWCNLELETLTSKMACTILLLEFRTKFDFLLRSWKVLYKVWSNIYIIITGKFEVAAN